MYKRIVLPLAVLLIGLVGCGTSNDGGTAAGQDAPAAQGDAPSLARDVKFGETAGVAYNSSQFEVTVGAPVDYTTFAVPPMEGKYVALDVEAKLVDGVGGAVSAASFTLVDGAGNEYTFAAPNGADTKEQLFATLLTTGDSDKGIVVFDVPADPGAVVVKFVPVTETKDFASWS